MKVDGLPCEEGGLDEYWFGSGVCMALTPLRLYFSGTQSRYSTHQYSMSKDCVVNRANPPLFEPG